MKQNNLSVTIKSNKNKMTKAEFKINDNTSIKIFRQ